jgi:ABC-type nitrate/sulfonate/bicarbonate transport system substrate-binding protein
MKYSLPRRVRRRQMLTLFALGSVGALALSACSAGGTEPKASSPASIDVAFTAHTAPTLVPVEYGIDNYTDDFDLNMSVKDNVTTFDSHTTAMQTVLGGRAQVLGGSVAAILATREQGEDFKIFCPRISMDDFVLAGSNGVTTIEQLFDRNVRVGIDSPGGAGAIILNALLIGVGEDRGIQDIPSPQIIESSGLRTSAFAAGEIDATVIHDTQYVQAEAQLPDATRIATLYKDVDTFIKEAQAAPAKWLDENRDLAARYCATTLVAMHDLKADYNVFQGAVKTYVEEPPSDKDLKILFDLIQKYPFWTDDGGLSDASIQFMIDVSKASGVLTKDMDASDVVDRKTLDLAVELAAKQIDK